MDAKGRMALPVRFREPLRERFGGALVATIDTAERCLLLYPQTVWEETQAQLEALPNVDPTTRRFQRLLIGHATDLDLDGNGQYDALTDGLLLLRGMFGLSSDTLVSGVVSSDAAYSESRDIEERIETLGELADIDGNGNIDALTDGILTLRYLFGLEGSDLIDGVVANNSTRTTAQQIKAHLDTLAPSLEP